MKKISLQVILLFCIAVFAQNIWAEKPLHPPIFRYKNDAGVKVTTYVLPPEASGKGYEIINDKGDILETVKPAPTESEKKAFLSAIEQEKYDKTLILKYGSLAELMKAQKRLNAELDSKMSVLRGNFSNIKSQIDAEQVKAANIERQGRAVPESSLTMLEALYASYEQTESLLHEREKEIEEERARYEQEFLRYKQLKGLK